MKEIIRKAYINKNTKQLSITIPKKMLSKSILKEKNVHFKVRAVRIKDG